MSLATELTEIQVRLTQAGRQASEYLRGHKQVIPAEVYNELQLKLITVASEATKLKLALAEFVPMVPEHPICDERAAFARELQHIGDDTLNERSPLNEAGASHG